MNMVDISMLQKFLGRLSLDESEDQFDTLGSPKFSEKSTHPQLSLNQRPVIDSSTMYNAVSVEPGQFRILQLDPAHHPDDPIVAHLITAPVHSPPMYDALSYRWEGGDSQTVSINGADLHVTDNLYAALRSLRREAGPLPRMIWVDSLCINQGSPAERAEQVKLMGEIYTQARTVRIWLGEECPGVESALQLVRECGTMTPAEVVRRVLDDEDGARALVKLLQRSYWSRTWMFQEVVLAADAMVHCGSHEVPWNALKWLHQVTSEAPFWEDLEVEKPWVREMRRAVFRISLFTIPREEAEEIDPVSISTRQLQATDPRDKIYGLLGVCQALAKRIKVDYAVPVQDVYADFARSRIETEGELSTLLTARPWVPQNGEDLGLPSWVPDLRGDSGVDTRYLSGAYLGNYNADGGSEPYFAFSKRGDHHILEVEALVWDTVQVHEKFGSQEEEQRRALIDTFCRTADGSDFSTSKLCQYFQALTFGKCHSTGANGPDKRQQKSLERLALGFYEDLEHLYGPQQAFIGFLQSFRESGLDLLDEDSSQLSPDFGPDELRRDKAELLYRTRSDEDVESAIFSTANGCIGVCPQTLEQGDVVAIVRGSRVPLVLRQQDDCFRLIGPSYLSKIMQGEAVSGGHLSPGQSFERVEIS
jgi:hypothetical protein